MAAPQGISIACDDDTLVETPTWTRIDTSYNVQSWSIDRGRSYELDKTATGTATINIVDKTGAFDPTNTGGTFYHRVEPMKQAAIALQNPRTAAWTTLFRGFISSVAWVPYQNLQFANVRLELVDGMAVLGAMEMAPDGTFGDSVTTDGNIVFDAQPHTDGVQRRIGDGITYTGVLSQAGWPAGLRQIFTGNVHLQEYLAPPRASVLSVILDAADSEHPVASNVFINRDGEVTFHGRKARFDPDTTSSGTDWAFTRWPIGDNAAVLASPTTVVPMSPPLAVVRDNSNVYTAALALPEDPTGVLLTSSGITGNYATALTVGDYGLRTWSAENLGTGAVDTAGSTTELQATKLFADYVIANYSTPQTRVGQVTVRPHHPSGISGSATWAMIGGVDISDIVEITTTHKGGGGFSGTEFYVEGVHYDCRPANGTYPDITLTLDLSPFSFYSDGSMF